MAKLSDEELLQKFGDLIVDAENPCNTAAEKSDIETRYIALGGQILDRMPERMGKVKNENS